MRVSTAVKFFGSKAEMARALGISRQSVTGWGDTVPELRAIQIEKLTGGAVKAPPMKPYLQDSAAA